MPYVIQLDEESWYAGPDPSAGLLPGPRVHEVSLIELAHRYDEFPTIDLQILHAKGFDAEVERVP